MSGLWGLDETGTSTVAFGGVGGPFLPWDPSSQGASAPPFVRRDTNSDLPERILGLAGSSFQGTYHSHPDKPGKNNVSSVQATDSRPGSDRELALELDGRVFANGPGSGRSVNVLMNPGVNGKTIIYTSSGDIMSVSTESLIMWQVVDNNIAK